MKVDPRVRRTWGLPLRGSEPQGWRFLTEFTHLRYGLAQDLISLHQEVLSGQATAVTGGHALGRECLVTSTVPRTLGWCSEVLHPLSEQCLSKLRLQREPIIVKIQLLKHFEKRICDLVDLTQ